MGGENIFLFIPNIIGYIRILFTVIACYLMFSHPLVAAFCFTLSHTVLDDLDGIAARWFKQATRFGGVFDIVIDRCSFLVWLMGLCVLYPQYTLFLQLIGMLDIMRILMKMYSSALNGHKNSESNWILQFYYTDTGQRVFSYGSEVFFVLLHLCHFSPGPVGHEYGLWQIGAAMLFPLVVIKLPISALILKAGCQGIATVDYAERAALQKQSN